jgi:uncharacterized membrane protein
MTTIILNAILLVVLVLGIGYIAERKLSPSGRIIFLSVGFILTVIRVGSLWFVQYREWTNTQSISYFWLILLLFPEGLLAQYLMSEAAAPERSVWDVLLFSELLTLGSFIFAYLLAFANGSLKSEGKNM